MKKQISRPVAWLMLAIFLGGAALLTGFSLYFYHSSIVIFLSLFLGYLFHGLTFSILMLILSYLGLKQRSKKTPINKKKNTVSVAIPVFNEAEVIIASVDSILKQSLKPFEIIIINDGSTDDTLQKLINVYQLKAITLDSISNIKTTSIFNIYQSNKIKNLFVIDKQHQGKADALNAALNISRGEIFLTIDADSVLHHKAIEKLVQAIVNDKLVIAAGGIVKAANGIPAKILATEEGHLPSKLLPKIQWIEYSAGFVWRFGWSFINTLLLISGSFGAFRTEVLRKCQGFDTKSITEDYEMVYRLHAYHLANKIPYKMVTVPDALSYTLVPETLFGLIKQRIRWFQGFLQTLLNYRQLVLRQSYGVLGIFMLPIKCIDAISPLWSISVYLFLAYQLTYQTFPISTTLLIELVAIRWSIDIVMLWVLLALHYRFVIAPLTKKERLYIWLLSPIYLLTNQFLWYVYSIGAYYRLIRGIKRWDKLERRGFEQLQTSENFIVSKIAEKESVL